MELTKWARMYITEVDEAFDGDVFFPEYPSDEWREVSRTPGVSQTELHYAFVLYERVVRD